MTPLHAPVACLPTSAHRSPSSTQRHNGGGTADFTNVVLKFFESELRPEHNCSFGLVHEWTRQRPLLLTPLRVQLDIKTHSSMGHGVASQSAPMSYYLFSFHLLNHGVAS